MISYSNTCRYYVYQDACNMRYSFDRLGGIVNAHMEGNLLSGDIFIFINKRKNQCKLLRWSEDGFEIFHKRLVKGTFAVPPNGQIEAYELQLMISGVVLERYRKKKRFSIKNVV
ncbi:IS66 Orf2 like protein [Arachidicoccus rhizosphaerae]|uniref:IS66 Orf2 like protein n=1 Tax=Arachidicoccus rhizosphaerae TaxID=551991 RepID=A0A1H3XYW1_9BACT|nr:IS66 family insertion sequence element accessory protein TnpB [Arachidicoccus rhizosphaerae]SEA04645.1 IS66 Orf2 like protein [Arachidicoccus rhizosphaerae]SEA34842.1 IS66 Orf2 like protein [Arachidicoccus rhizosphaerae]SEA61906.1 IS66 Orf2 like protein [Arachidicoccus rhizosphaerae]